MATVPRADVGFSLAGHHRTPHHIRRHADRLLPPEFADVNENAKALSGKRFAVHFNAKIY